MERKKKVLEVWETHRDMSFDELCERFATSSPDTLSRWIRESGSTTRRNLTIEKHHGKTPERFLKSMLFCLLLSCAHLSTECEHSEECKTSDKPLYREQCASWCLDKTRKESDAWHECTKKCWQEVELCLCY